MLGRASRGRPSLRYFTGVLPSASQGHLVQGQQLTVSAGTRTLNLTKASQVSLTNAFQNQAGSCTRSRVNRDLTSTVLTWTWKLWEDRRGCLGKGSGKKKFSIVFTQRRKLSRAVERVRRHRCDSLGQMQEANSQGILSCFLRIRERGRFEQFRTVCYEGKHILGSLHILPIHYIAYSSVLLIESQKATKK